MKKNEKEDKEILSLVGQPATRENLRKMKYGGGVGADGLIKSVITRTEMEKQRSKCPYLTLENQIMILWKERGMTVETIRVETKKGMIIHTIISRRKKE